MASCNVKKSQNNPKAPWTSEIIKKKFFKNKEDSKVLKAANFLETKILLLLKHVTRW